MLIYLVNGADWIEMNFRMYYLVKITWVWHLNMGQLLFLSVSLFLVEGFYSLISNLIWGYVCVCVYIYILNPVLNELNHRSVYLSFILCQCQIVPNFIAEMMEWYRLIWKTWVFKELWSLVLKKK
jgi:hypothetical protein